MHQTDSSPRPRWARVFLTDRATAHNPYVGLAQPVLAQSHRRRAPPSPAPGGGFVRRYKEAGHNPFVGTFRHAPSLAATDPSVHKTPPGRGLITPPIPPLFPIVALF